LITVGVEEVVVDTTVAGFALLRAFSTRVGFLAVVVLTSILSADSSFFVTLTALAPFLALTGVDFLLTLISAAVAICAAAVLAEAAAAEAAKLFFFFMEAVDVVTELELSTEINEMSDLSDLVDESVSRLRRFFSLFSRLST
jgi:hypothetical protein